MDRSEAEAEILSAANVFREKHGRMWAKQNKRKYVPDPISDLEDAARSCRHFGLVSHDVLRAAGFRPGRSD